MRYEQCRSGAGNPFHSFRLYGQRIRSRQSVWCAACNALVTSAAVHQIDAGRSRLLADGHSVVIDDLSTSQVDNLQDADNDKTSVRQGRHRPRRRSDRAYSWILARVVFHLAARISGQRSV